MDLTRQEEKECFSPWTRDRIGSYTPYIDDGSISLRPRHSFKEKFTHRRRANRHLDIDAKIAALKASMFVVSVVSYRGEEAIFRGSGTNIGCEEVDGTYTSTILTSASLLRHSPNVNSVPGDIKLKVYFSNGELFEGHVLACDFHYNIATIMIKSDAALPTASLKHLDDSITVDPSAIPCPEDKAAGSKSFALRAHSKANLVKLCPGDMAVAVGRYFEKSFGLMAASGEFRLDFCNFDCTELFSTSCIISKCGIGGPLINQFGEVIGVNFYDRRCTPFLPINIVSKCLEYFKKNGRYTRPWLGMVMTNLYAARVSKLEKIIGNPLNTFKGVLVEKVKEGSPAESAGIFRGDVIVQCGGNIVGSFLEFCDIICDKVGESVEVVVKRKTGACMKLTVVIDETCPEKFNRWPLPQEWNWNGLWMSS